MSRYDEIEEVRKFNQNHDRRGRFSSSRGKSGHKSSYLTENFGANPETYEKVAKDLKVDESEAKRLVKGIWTFSGNLYANVRAGSRGESNVFQEDADACEEFIEKSPKWSNGQLHRGIHVDTNVADEMLRRVQNNEPIDMRGLSSWSSNPKIATRFAKTQKRSGVSVIFHTNNTATSQGTSISHLSQYPHQKEVLMSSKSVFTPTNVVQQGKIIHIYGDMS